MTCKCGNDCCNLQPVYMTPEEVVAWQADPASSGEDKPDTSIVRGID